MKILKQSLVAMCFVPFILLGFVIAFFRLIFTLTLEFSWDMSTKYFDKWLTWTNDNVQLLTKDKTNNND